MIDKYRQGYEIERIVDVRESGAPNELEYLVQWKGFPLLGDTDRWEPERRLAEGLSPGEATHLRDSLEQVRTRKREDGQPSVMPHGALAELRAHFGVQGWSDLRGGDIRATLVRTSFRNFIIDRSYGARRRHRALAAHRATAPSGAALGLRGSSATPSGLAHGSGLRSDPASFGSPHQRSALNHSFLRSI